MSEAYFTHCCLGKIEGNKRDDPFSSLKFAGVYSAQENGVPKEQIDVLEPIIPKQAKFLSNYIHNFKVKHIRLKKLKGIDKLDNDKLIVSLTYDFCCVGIVEKFGKILLKP